MAIFIFLPVVPPPHPVPPPARLPRQPGVIDVLMFDMEEGAKKMEGKLRLEG